MRWPGRRRVEHPAGTVHLRPAFYRLACGACGETATLDPREECLEAWVPAHRDARLLVPHVLKPVACHGPACPLCLEEGGP